MPDPLAHVYDLALRALDEQERQVVELRSRLAAAMAGVGLIASLLIRPALHHDRGPVLPHGILVGSGLVGMGVAAFSAMYLLGSAHLWFGVDATLAADVIRRSGVGDVEGFYLSMIRVLDERRLHNLAVLRRLEVAFTVMLCGILVAVCGLVAALVVA